ncbi:MAG: hypothetical protein GYB31_08265 [Bacteroidetes bacterium]|nr:hypothetical protein [Bacteroidota bacterium]
MDKKLIVFCPNPYSLYTNTVCELLLRKGYHIELIVVRKFTLQRFKNEFARDGKRLLRKIWNKLVLREKAYTDKADSIVSFRRDNNLSITNITQFQKQGTKILRCRNLNDKSIEKALNQYDEKLVIFTGGGIIRKNILDRAGDGIINCHLGILPKYKGMDLPEWCLLEDEPDQLGITLHFMDTGIDTGDILRKVKVVPKQPDSIRSLRSGFEPVMVTEMVRVVSDYLNGKVERQPQPKSNKRQYFILHPKLYEIAEAKLKQLVES